MPRRLPRRRTINPWIGLFAILCTLAFFAGAAYLGIVVMLVGGIVAAVHAAQASPVDTGHLTWMIIRALLFELPFTAAWLLTLFTWALAAEFS